MKRNVYKAPWLEEVELRVERGFEASDEQWYDEGGQGDFDYSVEEDETWG